MKNSRKLFALALVTLLSVGMISCEKEEKTENTQEQDLGIKGFDEKGASYAYFSVSPTRVIYFSRGNLQYQASTNTWRFAEHQYDYIGSGNSKISASNTGWIDLFGFATSGYSGAQPYSTSTDSSEYGLGGDLTGGTANFDWAFYNAISNGGNKSHMWRTLTMDEWDYLFHGRNNSNNKFAPATVNDVHGFVVLSDVPLDTTSLPFNSVSDGAKGWNSNIYTKAQWLRMEKTGAVFLPAAGERYNGNKVKNCGTTGSYWTTSAYRMKNAYYILFSEQNLSVEMTSARYNGFSVRPVLQ